MKPAALLLLRAPQGVTIILACGACHGNRFLATTRLFLLGAAAGGMYLRFHLGRFTEIAQRIEKPS